MTNNNNKVNNDKLRIYRKIRNMNYLRINGYLFEKLKIEMNYEPIYNEGNKNLESIEEVLKYYDEIAIEYNDENLKKQIKILKKNISHLKSCQNDLMQFFR